MSSQECLGQLNVKNEKMKEGINVHGSGLTCFFFEDPDPDGFLLE